MPVLAEAGVVDSGGAGLVCFFEGVHMAVLGQSIDESADLSELLASPSANISTSFGPDSELEYGYCTEFILQLLNANQIQVFLS